jgi:hypothetical protein
VEIPAASGLFHFVAIKLVKLTVLLSNCALPPVPRPLWQLQQNVQVVGAVIVLMLGLYLSGAAILIGGEVNSEMRSAAVQAGVAAAKGDLEASPPA